MLSRDAQRFLGHRRRGQEERVRRGCGVVSQHEDACRTQRERLRRQARPRAGQCKLTRSSSASTTDRGVPRSDVRSANAGDVVGDEGRTPAEGPVGRVEAVLRVALVLDRRCGSGRVGGRLHLVGIEGFVRPVYRYCPTAARREPLITCVLGTRRGGYTRRASDDCCLLLSSCRACRSPS